MAVTARRVAPTTMMTMRAVTPTMAVPSAWSLGVMESACTTKPWMVEK